MESVGSGSRSSGGRGGLQEADDGDDKPKPSSRMMTQSARLNLCLNTPQAEEGPDQAEASAGGVAMLPQRRETTAASKLTSGADTTSTAASTTVPPTVRANAGPSSGSSVVGWSEDGPIRASSSDPPSPPAARHASPQRALQSNGGRAQGASTSAGQRASETRPTTSSAPRRSAPSNTNAAANVAAGVPAATGVGSNGANSLPEDDKQNPSEGCTKKQKLIIGGIALLVIIVAVVVVLVLLLGGGSDETDTPVSVTPGESAPPAESPTSAPIDGEPLLTLGTVAQRGTLKCGISLKQGFGSVTNGQYEGFDVDLVSTRKK